MKTHKVLCTFLIAACLNGPTLHAQNDVKEQLTIQLSDPAKPGMLEVSLIRGSIHVITHTGKDLIIDAVAKSPNERNEESRDEAAKGMKRISSGRSGLDLTVEEEKNHVTIHPNTMRSPVNLVIKVPQKFSLKLKAVNEGSITVDNVNGEFEISNVNGGIQLNNVSGSVVANTVNGDLNAVFRAVTPESPMAFSTLNGKVDVTFPATARYDVRIKSDRGEIYSDFDIEIDKTQPKTTKTAKDGLYKVSVSDWVQGKINGGGKEVMMKNMNGNIYLRKAR
jgi:DUF4097 and DUF4098 domain-containing protein YvlB